MDKCNEIKRKNNDERESFPPLPSPKAAFGRSSKTSRTPPKSAGKPVTVEEDNTGNSSDPAISSMEDRLMDTSEGCLTPLASDAVTSDVPRFSPKRQYIRDMRAAEETALQKCKDILAVMTAACKKHINTSMSIKNGVLELQEALDVITLHRSSWLRAEKELQVSTHEVPVKSVDASSTRAGGEKRAASSPAEQEVDKRRRWEGDEKSAPQWSDVVSRKTKRKAKAVEEKSQQQQQQPARENPSQKKKSATAEGRGTKAETKKKKKRSPKPRREALLIKPAQGKSFADVLGEIRTKANPADTETEVASVRQTRSGEVLVELEPGAKNKAAFGEALRGILGSNASVRSLEPRETLEVRDLDCLATSEEVVQAIKRDLPNISEDLKVSVSKENSRGLRVAVVTLNAKAAGELLEKRHIKIGWVRCRIRQRAVVARCYKCLSFGHMAASCRGPDRSSACYKCGSTEHKSVDCSSAERCFLCTERGLGQDRVNHRAGSGGCEVFREALGKAKSSIK